MMLELFKHRLVHAQTIMNYEHLLEKGVWVPIMISEYPDGSWSADIRQDGRDLLTCHGGPIDRIIGRLATR
ncbi:hypothetical protein A2765_01365 [Candidatus Kaiserbacteria bacterium RIFCSPHIGHO2_01_FULL_56_24]|uniref:Uncharacterized protein n=1 Tax=Candidatus Kaiserbacteria bacterium RIFCSPHIGHO2_01_FULL_56_24 TaxID=1798487 RepID=A0A1F6DH61_9BACT|nr:MAG: hypothetical protein A2765_01365 [Candidatus Kaiserbacteria bacterium RIFCSPHIGHO2_01_FULL_56_24]